MGFFSAKQLPVTSYGYLPPRGAVAAGWICATPFDSETDTGCGIQGDDVPRRWPFACPTCGGPTDVLLAEPWQHEAKGVELQYSMQHGIEDNGVVPYQWIMWRHEDALRKGDAHTLSQVRNEFRDFDDKLPIEKSFRSMAYFVFVQAALQDGDLDSAADDISHWQALSSADGVVGDGGARRGNYCNVIRKSMEFLAAPGGAGHPSANSIRQRCLDLAAGAYEALPRDLQDAVTSLSRGY